jgi:hypothetical protein
MDNLDASAVYDDSNFGNDGTYNGGLDFGDVVPGIVEDALRFNGDGYINLDDPPEFGFTSSDDFTVCAWVNMLSLDGDWRTIIGKGDNQWALQHSGGHQPAFSIYDGSGWDTSFYSGLALTVGQWYHVCGIKEGTEASVWVDGTKTNAPETTTGPANSNYEVHIGHNSQLDRYIDARIDEVFIFNKALTQGEIDDLFQEGA